MSHPLRRRVNAAYRAAVADLDDAALQAIVDAAPTRERAKLRRIQKLPDHDLSLLARGVLTPTARAILKAR